MLLSILIDNGRVCDNLSLEKSSVGYHFIAFGWRDRFPSEGRANIQSGQRQALLARQLNAGSLAEATPHFLPDPLGACANAMYPSDAKQ